MKRLCFLLLLLAFSFSAQGQSAEELLNQALRLERSQGDYAGAIALYRQVAEMTGVERPLAGMALIQMAQAYENLGRSEAARTYQRVLSEYADMPDLIAEARQGYARTREVVSEASTAKEPMSRTSVDLPMSDDYLEEWGASLSPSGRFMAAIRYLPPGVGLLEIATGDIQVFSINPGDKGYGEYPRMSPSEETIALSWQPGDSGVSDVVLVDVSSGTHRVLFHTEKYLESHYGWTLKNGGVQVHDWKRDASTLLVSIYGRVEEHDPESNHFEGFLLVPVDGSEPKVLGGPNSLSVGPRSSTRLAWEYACLSEDGRYAFADFMVDAPESARNFIRRQDTTTGEILDWRTSASVDFSLWGCTWTTGEILYSQTAAGNQSIIAALPSDSNPFDDRVITQLSESDQTFLGSKQGDIPVLQRWSDDLYLVELDAESGAALTRPKRIGDRVMVGSLTAWSPGGRRIAWLGVGSRGPVMIWDADRDQTTEFSYEGLLRGSNSWISDSVIYLAKSHPDSPTDWKTRWDTIHFDLDAGTRVDSISAEVYSRHGLRARFSIPDGPSKIGWSSETGCLQRLNLETDETMPFLCDPELGANGNPVTIPSPDLSQYLVWSHPSPDTLSVGVVGRDGSGYRELIKESLGEVEVGDARVERKCRATWGRSNEIILGCGPVRISTLKRIDVNTGEVSEPYSDLLSQFDIWQFRLSPNGTTAAIHGTGKGALERMLTMTVIHNVVREN